MQRLSAIAHGTHQIGQGRAQRFVIVDDCEKKGFPSDMATRVAHDHSNAIAEDAALTELEPPSDQQIRLTLESRYWAGT